MRIRTGYSFRAAVGRLPDVVTRLQEIGATFAPITDRASTFAYTQWTDLATKAGLVPVYGLELAVAVDEIKPMKAGRGKRPPPFDYWTFYAHNDITVINRLMELATKQFCYEPMVTRDQALATRFKASIVTGHRTILTSTYDNTYCGLSPSMPVAVYRRNMDVGHPFVAVSDNKYPRPEDHGWYEVAIGRNAETTLYPQWILDRDEWTHAVQSRTGANDSDAIDAWANAQRIMESCRGVKLQTGQLPKPPEGEGLRELCMDGARRLNLNHDKEYLSRLDHELSVIQAKGFEDYFLIVADIVSWARDNIMVGPARGSSCGSLVCYLTGITTVDPIQHGLLFERFLDEHRNDLPDIDIDFSDASRHLVFEYIREQYGEANVARLGTVAMFKGRSALNETAKALKVPLWKIDKVANVLIDRSPGDDRANHTVEDTLNTTEAGQALLKEHPEMAVAAKLEGHPRHYSQHAAGVVLSRGPISKIVAIDHRTGATHCDKRDAEHGYNLLKIDCLGLTQLSILEDTLEMARLPHDYLETIDTNDVDAFEVLVDGNFSGIFQFAGSALQELTRSVGVSSFDDIVALTALARPGPLGSGSAHDWVARRNNDQPVTYPHPLFEPFLGETLGLIIYQEQVMQIARYLGDLSWEDTTKLRRIMGKSGGTEAFGAYGDRWKSAIIAKGVPAETADRVWDELCAHGAYSFNKSHAVAYALISYWCCHLKARYPFEFAASTLNHEPDPDKQILILRELVAEGYDYVPYDNVRSGLKWTVSRKDGKRILVGPLSVVKGIGPATAQELHHLRENGHRIPDSAAIGKSVSALLTNPKTAIDSLWPIKDAIARLMPDPAAMNILSTPVEIGRIEKTAGNQTVLLIGVLSSIKPVDENEPARIKRRGYAFDNGPTLSLNLQVADDTGSIFAKVDRRAFEAVGRQILETSKPGKSIWALKGEVWGHRGDPTNTFKGVSVSRAKYIGDID